MYIHDNTRLIIYMYHIHTRDHISKDKSKKN